MRYMITHSETGNIIKMTDDRADALIFTCLCDRVICTDHITGDRYQIPQQGQMRNGRGIGIDHAMTAWSTGRIETEFMGYSKC